MDEEQFFIAPSVRIRISWNNRMVSALHKRFWAIMHDQHNPDVSEYLKLEYTQWKQARIAAYTQIRQLYQLTRTLAMPGDTLMMSTLDGKPNHVGELRIEQRTTHAWEGSSGIIVAYQLCPTDIVEFEEYQEGDNIE